MANGISQVDPMGLDFSLTTSIQWWAVFPSQDMAQMSKAQQQDSCKGTKKAPAATDKCAISITESAYKQWEKVFALDNLGWVII